MKQMFDFTGIEKSENAIKRTWLQFRQALEKGEFIFNNIEKAKETTFLKVYNDLFNDNSGFKYNTILVKELEEKSLGRGTILSTEETLNYERFLPKKEFIKDDNRFSPKEIEWLYLAIGTEEEIHKCAQAECRVKDGQRFGFCNFKFNESFKDLKLVDLTIADNISYFDLNQELEVYMENNVKKSIEQANKFGSYKKINQDEFKEVFGRWSVYTYSKLLSEQIFLPLSNTDDRGIMYAPFHTMAQYYISLGYAGIIFGSTVCNEGKNIVLFDKAIAEPTGKIEEYVI